ncbi:MAG: glycosyltransferase family 4 protein [Planctomycetota bacterium]|jgi:glycosyltransferase involved in cell wall biosynthesis
MRVVLSAGKRGHYYLTARAFQNHGVLGRFITHTFFKQRSWRRRLFPDRLVHTRSDPDLADRRVTSLWPIELPWQAIRPLLGRFDRLGMHCYNTLYDLASVPFVVGHGDVFHFANTYGVYSGAAAKRAGMKVVVDQQSVHPAYSIEVVEPEYRRLGMWDLGTDRRKVRRIVAELELADLILAPSRFVYDENVKRGIPAAKQRVVPLGVDTDLFRPGPRARRRSDRFRILFVGRINAWKGVHDLLAAVAALDDPRVELTLVGAVAPDFRGHLARQRGRFTHVPTVSPRKLAELYREADAFTLPSLAEGSALVTYEAMASGLPCVVTRSAGSLVEHRRDGLVVPLRRPDALAQALAALMEAPDWARALGAAARESAEACDVKQYGERLLAAYGEFFGKS